jgi:hypothetical protein
VETWKAERVSDRTSDGHGRSPLQGFCEHFRGRQHGDLTLAERHRHVALVERHMCPVLLATLPTAADGKRPVRRLSFTTPDTDPYLGERGGWRHTWVSRDSCRSA